MCRRKVGQNNVNLPILVDIKSKNRNSTFTNEIPSSIPFYRDRVALVVGEQGYSFNDQLLFGDLKKNDVEYLRDKLNNMHFLDPTLNRLVRYLEIINMLFSTLGLFGYLFTYIGTPSRITKAFSPVEFILCLILSMMFNTVLIIVQAVATKDLPALKLQARMAELDAMISTLNKTVFNSIGCRLTRSTQGAIVYINDGEKVNGDVEGKRMKILKWN